MYVNFNYTLFYIQLKKKGTSFPFSLPNLAGFGDFQKFKSCYNLLYPIAKKPIIKKVGSRILKKIWVSLKCHCKRLLSVKLIRNTLQHQEGIKKKPREKGSLKKQ